MKRSDFLEKLKAEGKLELVEPAEEIALSYRKKSSDSLQVAKLAFNSGYFENAVGEAYYSMYNSVQSLFFRCGIKCENHSAAAILLSNLFRQDKLHKEFSKAKEERIDKQYYITPKQTKPATKDSCREFIASAERFALELEDFKSNLKNADIEKIRKDFA